jgi:RNA polymerase sigma-70 factor, ECF subfamily
MGSKVDDTDERIRAGFENGDSAVIGLIWDAYGERLYGFIHTLVGSHHDAEEVLQDVFVKAARHREQLARARNLKAYLFTMARNETLTFVKRRRREVPVAPAELHVLPAPEPKSNPGSSAEVGRALAALPEDQRTVVVLKTYHEMTFLEIGEVLAISPNTAASRYRYALEKLRTLLCEVDHDYRA